MGGNLAIEDATNKTLKGTQVDRTNLSVIKAKSNESMTEKPSNNHTFNFSIFISVLLIIAIGGLLFASYFIYKKLEL